MRRKREDFIVTVLRHGVSLIIGMIIVGLLMTIINYTFKPKLLIVNPFEVRAEASLFHKEKPKAKKIHPLKITTSPKPVHVLKVNNDNSLLVKGKDTRAKTVSLYLITFPPEGYYHATEAHKALKKAVSGKQLWISKDQQSENDNQVYLETRDSLVQADLLSSGDVSLHNYNGAEKYFDYLKYKEIKARSKSKGVWQLPGYVTDVGYNRKVGRIDGK